MKTNQPANTIVYTSNGVVSRPARGFVSNMHAEDSRANLFTCSNLFIFIFLVLTGILLYFIWDSVVWLWRAVVTGLPVSLAFLYLPAGLKPGDYILREYIPDEYTFWIKESGQFIRIDTAFSRRVAIRKFKQLAEVYGMVYLYDPDGNQIARSGFGRIAYDQPGDLQPANYNVDLYF